MSSSSTAAPRTANNLDYSRKQLVRTSSSGSAGGLAARFRGFEYAVQSDGSSLAERMWQELRHAGNNTYFQLQKGDGASFRSIHDLDQILRTSVQQHQHQCRLPVATKILSNSATNENYNSRNFSAPPPQTFVPGPPANSYSIQPSSSTSIRTTPVPAQHLTSFQHQNDNGTADKNNGFQSASAILANHCHTKNSIVHACAPTFNNRTSSVPPFGAAHHNQHVPPPQPLDVVEDDFDDALLASIDVDQLLSQRRISNENHHHLYCRMAMSMTTKNSSK